MVNVVLHGKFGKRFRGNKADGSWLLDVKTPAEALQAIEANRGGLRKYLIDQDKKGIEYRVVIDGKDFEHVDEIVIPMGEYATIEFIPLLCGASSSSLWQIIAGVVLIIVGIILIAVPGLGGAAIYSGATLTFAQIGTSIALAGLGYVLAGVANLIFSPSADTEGPKNKPSYLFSGQVNTTTQGGPVPVLYGELITGSQIISAYLRTVEVDLDGQTISQTGSDPIPGNLDQGGTNGGPFDGDRYPDSPMGPTSVNGFTHRLLPANANDPDFVRGQTVIGADEFAGY